MTEHKYQIRWRAPNGFTGYGQPIFPHRDVAEDWCSHLNKQYPGFHHWTLLVNVTRWNQAEPIQ